MKKFFGVLILFTILGCSYFIVYFKVGGMKLNQEEYKVELISKGLENGEDFTFDDDGNIYVSQKNKLVRINKDNSKEIVFEEKGINVMDIAYLNGEILYLYDDKLNSYNLKTKRHKLIIDSIPTGGDYSDNKILIKNKEIYLTIGAKTNSGVVGEDNNWKENGQYDLATEEIALNKIKFKGTGGYSPYKKILSDDYIIKESRIGNASIIKVNPETKEVNLIGDGIRNVEGIDFDSSGKIYITVGGIEDRGARPLYGDTDYIYELEKKAWYGWPDYSGGDPVNSVRFRKEGKEKQRFLIEKHDRIPKAPLYQHNEINALGAMTIDKLGEIGSKDSFFIYDKLKGSIINLKREGAQTTILNLEDADIEKLIIKDESLYILDKKNGFMLKVFDINNKIAITEKIKVIGIAITVMITISLLLFLVIKRYCK
ncbi:MAG: hypothetical protein ACRCTZ_10875 [Sarcina sp.]